MPSPFSSLFGRGAASEPAISAQLLDALREFIAREIDAARGEIERSRQVVRDAVGRLQTALNALAAQSNEQGTLVTDMVEQDGAGSPGLRRFADEAGALIGNLTQTLTHGSHESVKTVETIDQMAQHLDGIFELMRDLKALADHTMGLAAGAAARSAEPAGDLQHSLATVADEVRHLAERSSDFNERVKALVNSARDVVGRVRVRVEENADRDMNASIEAKTRADALARQAMGVNRALAAGARAVADSGRSIADGVSAAVRSLRFEDAASGAMAAAEAHLERLAQINREAAELQRTLADPRQSSLVLERALEKFEKQLRRP